MAGGGGNIFRGNPQNVQVGGGTQSQPVLNNQGVIPQIQNPFGGMFAAQSPAQGQQPQQQQQFQQPQQQQGNFQPFAVPSLPNPFVSLAPNEPVTLRPEHITVAPQFGLSVTPYGNMGGIPPLRFAEGGSSNPYEGLDYTQLSAMVEQQPGGFNNTSSTLYRAFVNSLPAHLRAYYPTYTGGEGTDTPEVTNASGFGPVGVTTANPYAGLNYQQLMGMLNAQFPPNLWGNSAQETYDLTMQYGAHPLYAAMYNALPGHLQSISYFLPPITGPGDRYYNLWQYQADQMRGQWLATNGKDPWTVTPIATRPVTTSIVTTLPGTTLPGTTLPGTTLSGTTLPATTLPATTLSPRTTLSPGTTLPPGTTPPFTISRGPLFSSRIPITQANTPRVTGQIITFGGTLPPNTLPPPPPTRGGSDTLNYLAGLYPYSGKIGFSPFDPSRFNFGIPWVPSDALPYAPAAAQQAQQAPASGMQAQQAPASLQAPASDPFAGGAAPAAQTKVSPFAGPIPIFNQSGIPGLASPFASSAQQVIDAQRAVMRELYARAAAESGAPAPVAPVAPSGGAASAKSGGIVPLLKRKKAKKTKK